MDIQLSQLKDDVVELVLAENSNAVNAYFDLKELASFTRLINAFQFDKTASIGNSEDKERNLVIYIYQDGTRIMLNLGGQQNSFLTKFTRKQWKQFKSIINKGTEII